MPTQRWPTENGITANPGGGQAAATELRPQVFSRVTTVASAGDSVILPGSTNGSLVYVANAAATNSMNVFPQKGEKINAGAADASVAMAANTAGVFFCTGDGTWNAVISGSASLPQDIATTATPTFAGVVLSTGTKTATAIAGAATLNKPSGKVTSEVGLTTAAGADYTLTLTNSVIAATDVVFASVAQGTNTTEGLAVQRVTPGAGSVVILVRNMHAADAWNGSIAVSFVVIKAA